MVFGHADSLVGVDAIGAQPIVTLRTEVGGRVRLASRALLLLAVPIVRGGGILADEDVLNQAVGIERLSADWAL